MFAIVNEFLQSLLDKCGSDFAVTVNKSPENTKINSNYKEWSV